MRGTLASARAAAVPAGAAGRAARGTASRAGWRAKPRSPGAVAVGPSGFFPAGAIDARGHRIDAAVAPRIAAQDAPCGQVRAARRTVRAQGLDGIVAAARVKAALAAEHRGQRVLIGAHDADADLRRDAHALRPAASAVLRRARR